MGRFLVNRVMLGVLSLGLIACELDRQTPEEQIESLIEVAIDAAENRDLGDLMQHLRPDYLDQKGYQKAQMEKLLRLYFFRHKRIYIWSKVKQIELLSASQANAVLYLAMAGGTITDASMLAGVRASIYEVKLDLVKDDRWRVQRSSWHPANLTEVN